MREELEVLHELPERRFDSCHRLEPRVRASSTVRIKNNVYSLHSRLIGEKVKAKVFREHIEVWYGGFCIETLPRLQGRNNHCINYRHIIDWLVRKPGAFERYRYRDSLFPTSRFRMAYDQFKSADESRGHKEYLKLLELAARENETAVDECLRRAIDQGEAICVKQISEQVKAEPDLSAPRDAHVEPIDLEEYDTLCGNWVEEYEEAWERKSPADCFATRLSVHPTRGIVFVAQRTAHASPARML